MATRLSAESSLGEERMERELEELRSQVQREKEKVKGYFHQLHLLLAAREESVLRELDEIVERVRAELTEKRALLQQLNTAREALERYLTENKLRELLQKNVRSLEDGMGEVLGGEGVTVGWVEVEWNVEGVEVSVSDVCKVVCLKEKPVQCVDYSVKVRPVWSRVTRYKLCQDLAQTVEEKNGLRREVDELRRDTSVLKKRLEETEKDGTGFQLEENLRIQKRELESEKEGLYKEIEKLKKDKIVGNDYSDLLRSQKQGVERELEGVRARLKSAQKEGLKDTEKDGTSFQLEENLRIQIRELESEKEGLYKENEKLKKDKIVANDYSDLLRSQKQGVERELEQERASLFSTRKENEKLSQKLSLQPKGEDATPIPSRSKPFPRETQASKQPPDAELYSPEFNAELHSEVKAVSHKGTELRLRPITNLLDAEKHKGHRVVCECEDANRTPRYLEGVLECLFGDEGTTVAGVRFPTEVVGMSNGVYKEKEWFDAPEGKGGFFPNNSVYIST